MKFGNLPKDVWERYVESAEELIRKGYVPPEDEIKLAERIYNARNATDASQPADPASHNKDKSG